MSLKAVRQAVRSAPPETSRDALKRENALAQDFFQWNGVQGGQSYADARRGSSKASQRCCAAREVVVLLAFRFRARRSTREKRSSADAACRPLPWPPRRPRPRARASEAAANPAMLARCRSDAPPCAFRGGAGCCTSPVSRGALLDDELDSKLLHSAAQRLAQADVPGPAFAALRVGRMVALQKPNGRGVRALVVGDVFRRLVGRTLAQTFAPQLQQACLPHQYGLSTRAGTEALTCVLRAAVEIDPRATILSVDAVHGRL